MTGLLTCKWWNTVVTPLSKQTLKEAVTGVYEVMYLCDAICHMLYELSLILRRLPDEEHKAKKTNINFTCFDIQGALLRCRFWHLTPLSNTIRDKKTVSKAVKHVDMPKVSTWTWKKGLSSFFFSLKPKYNKASNKFCPNNSFPKWSPSVINHSMLPFLSTLRT